jgi:putative hydrolase of HD superfamily
MYTELSKLDNLGPEGTTTPVSFFHFIERLKTTKREGWRRFGLNHGESISDHMYRMAIMTLFAPPALAARLDIAKCTKMALIHDMAEALVGDITPRDNVLKSEKSRRETETMDYLCKRLLGKVNGGLNGEEVRAVWQEYEDGLTEESKFVHDIDKIELLHQMVEYEKSNAGKLELSEFARVATRIELPEVRQWWEEIREEREAYWKGLGRDKAPTYEETKKDVQHDEYYGNEKVNGEVEKTADALSNV